MLSPTPLCSSYWKGSLQVTLDYGRQLYFLLIYKNCLKCSSQIYCTIIGHFQRVGQNSVFFFKIHRSYKWCMNSCSIIIEVWVVSQLTTWRMKSASQIQTSKGDSLSSFYTNAFHCVWKWLKWYFIHFLICIEQ